jgi:uncharacterized protein (DUF58 family)
VRLGLGALRRASTSNGEIPPPPIGGQAIDYARFGRLGFVVRQPAGRGLGGEHRSRRRAPATEFVDYRPYAVGDDLRRVDWNVYGRLRTLQVKLTEARERAELVLALDCSESMRWGKPDKLGFARQAAAALAYVGLARFDAVRVVRLGHAESGRSLGPVRGRARFAEVERFIAGSEPAGRADLDDELARCAGSAPLRLVVLVSDLLTPAGCERGLDALLAARAEVVVVHVVAPQERDPELFGELELVDAESGEALEVGLSLQALDQYRARYAAWRQQQRDQCAAREVRYVEAHTERSVATLLLDDLRRAGVLR